MRDSILELLERALSGGEDLPAIRRADLYDAAATLLSNAPGPLLLGQAAAAAAAAAQALRDAEGHQLTFAALLKQTNRVTPKP